MREINSGYLDDFAKKYVVCPGVVADGPLSAVRYRRSAIGGPLSVVRDR